MLKTAVQSQLDGVRSGLNQLQSALHDVHEIKESLDQVDEIYKALGPLQEKIQGVRNENQSFCQVSDRFSSDSSTLFSLLLSSTTQRLLPYMWKFCGVPFFIEFQCHF